MLSLHESDLLAVRLAPGHRWPELIQEAWGCGAAVLPVDHRLSESEVAHLYEAARPTAVIEGPQPPVRLKSGLPADPEVALVVATSGTAGAPKAVELTHAALKAAVEASSARLGSTNHDQWLCCLPLAHMGGMLVVARALLLGAPVAVQPRFGVENFEREHDARFTALVPTMLFRLLEARADLARFKAILIGGTALSKSLAARAQDAGAKLVATYGLTESCGGVVYDGIPLQETEFRIAEEDEIQLRGPTIMRGYRLNPDATKAAFTEDEWLRTSDAGAVTNKRLHIHGRLDDVITTGGEKVWPGEIEEAIRSHPAVADVAICGRPDPEWGERVVAYVVASNPTSPPTLESVRDLVTQTLAGFKAPREMILLDSLPRTATAKLRRKDL